MAVMLMQCTIATPKGDIGIQAGSSEGRLPVELAGLCCARCTEQRIPW